MKNLNEIENDRFNGNDVIKYQHEKFEVNLELRMVMIRIFSPFQITLRIKMKQAFFIKIKIKKKRDTVEIHWV